MNGDIAHDYLRFGGFVPFISCPTVFSVCMFEPYLSVFILALSYRVVHWGSGLAKTMALYDILGIFGPHVSTLRLRFWVHG